MSSSTGLIKPKFTSIRIEVTGGCNCRCSYCFASDTMAMRRGLDLPSTSMIALMEMVRRSRIRKVLFSGGEPLVRVDFPDILRAARGLETSFVTNGLLLTDELLQEFASIRNLRRIRISIDGFSAHDTMRVGSSHIFVLDRIAAVRGICPRLSITPHTTASPLAIPEIPSLLTELQRLKVDRWRLFMIRLGGAATSGNVRLTAAYIRDYVDLLAHIADRVGNGELTMQIEADGGYQSDLNRILDKHVFPEYRESTHPCEYLQHVLMIRNNGDISICPFFEFGLGKIEDYDSISKVEENVRLLAWRNHRVESIPQCSRCKYKRLCRSGCRKNAVELRGSFLAEDPLYCFMFPLLERLVWPRLPWRTQVHLRSQYEAGGEAPQWEADGVDELLHAYYEKSAQ